jgi:hypothetical protein
LYPKDVNGVFWATSYKSRADGSGYQIMFDTRGIARNARKFLTMLLACKLSTAIPLQTASLLGPLAAVAFAAFLSMSTACCRLSLNDSAIAPLPPQPGLGACAAGNASD